MESMSVDLEYGEAGLFEGLLEQLLFGEGEGAGGAGRRRWQEAADGAEGDSGLTVFLVAPDHGDEAAAGFEDAVSFGQGVADRGGVLEGVEAGDDIIGFVGEGQVFHFANKERVGGQAAARFFGKFDGGVKTRDEADFGGGEAQEIPCTAADIEEGLLAGEVKGGDGVVITGLRDWLLNGGPVFWLAAPELGLSGLGSHNGSVKVFG